MYTFNSENFEAEVINSDTPALVDFWAGWCGPCQIMIPLVENLAKEYEEKKIKIGKCNVDENADLAEKYGVMSIPAFLIFKDGEVVDQIVGSATEETLRAFIDNNL